MVDKVTTVPRSKLVEHVGIVSATTRTELSRALIVFLGIA
jgi:mRNA-degrading endonuclease toxin of MazEF toxin-antitoxin module